jgi:hypothetical protein
MLAIFLAFTLKLDVKGDTLAPKLVLTNANDAAMDGAGHTIDGFLVLLREITLSVDRRVVDILDGRRLNDIFDHEALDGFVTRNQFPAVQTVDGLLPTCVLLRAATVPALLRHG